MSQGKDLPKVIEKIASEIEQAEQSIESSDLPDTTKQFVVSCIRLAVWLPNALVEKKISLSNLRKLIFGNGKSRRSKRSKNSSNNKDKNEKKRPPIKHHNRALKKRIKPQLMMSLLHLKTKITRRVMDVCPMKCMPALFTIPYPF